MPGLRRLGQEDRDPVAGDEPVARQDVGQPVRRPPDVLEGPAADRSGLVLGDERRCVRPGGGVPVDRVDRDVVALGHPPAEGPAQVLVGSRRAAHPADDTGAPPTGRRRAGAEPRHRRATTAGRRHAPHLNCNLALHAVRATQRYPCGRPTCPPRTYPVRGPRPNDPSQGGAHEGRCRQGDRARRAARRPGTRSARQAAGGRARDPRRDAAPAPARRSPTPPTQRPARRSSRPTTCTATPTSSCASQKPSAAEVGRLRAGPGRRRAARAAHRPGDREGPGRRAA